MIDQQSLVPEKFQPKSNLVTRSLFNSLDTVKANHNTCLKVGIFISLAAVMQIPSLNQSAQATNTNNFKSQSLSSNQDKSFGYLGQKNKITDFLPRILSLINVSVKLQPETPTTDLSKFSANPNISPTYNQANRQNIIANRKKSYRATNIDSSSKSQQLIHLVQRGDTINQIARKYKVSRDELVQLNQLKNSNIIFVDQRLEIPISKANQVSPHTNGQPGSTMTSVVPSQAISSEETISKANSASLVSTVAPNNLSKLRQEKLNQEASQDDPYIAKLRAEIELLRARNKRQKSEIGNSQQLSSSLAVSNSEEKYQLESGREKSSGTTVKLNSSKPKYNLQPNLLEENAIALTLPPLPNYEEYLPSAFDGYIWPAKGVLTSGYGMRWGRMHQGIDIAAPLGTPIVAAASGEVISVGWQSGYGNLVKLEHLDGSVTVYAHNRRNLVSHGQQVDQGEQIAEMGSTGHSTGPHLHFEIHDKKQGIVNPLAFLSRK